MAIHNNGKSVVTCDGIILWDGVTKPETETYDGQPQYSLKIAIPETAAEKQELETLANTALMESKFKGQLPAGGNWPILPIDMSKFAEDAARLTGRVSINGKTKFIPEVFDINGQKLEPMQYASLLYPGAIVKMLVGAYPYDNKGNKGIAFSLDGIQIVDTSTPKLSVGGGLTTTEKQSAFMGGGQPAPAATPTPQSQGGVAPAPDFLNGPTPPSAEVSYIVNGQPYTESALRAAGYTDAHFATLQKA